MEVILASASPRRKKILTLLYEDFRVIKSDIREQVPHDLPIEKCPEYLAKQKAEAVAPGYNKSLVIGCDTSVVIDGTILNKPRSTSDARQMMEMLSGKTHQVITGCALCYMGQTQTFSETTEVEFYALTTEEIDEYIKTTEPYDKAGGYGIQDFANGEVYIESGSYSNVVGLPVEELTLLVEAFLNTEGQPHGSVFTEKESTGFSFNTCSFSFPELKELKMIIIKRGIKIILNLLILFVIID